MYGAGASMCTKKVIGPCPLRLAAFGLKAIGNTEGEDGFGYPATGEGGAEKLEIVLTGHRLDVSRSLPCAGFLTLLIL